MPDTGGANVPALNDLISPLGMAFSDSVYEGQYMLGEHDSTYTTSCLGLKAVMSQQHGELNKDTFMLLKFEPCAFLEKHLHIV